MSDEKLFSTITTVYNCAELLPFSLDSLIRAVSWFNPRDFTIVLLDDGSTDNGSTRNVCREFVEKYKHLDIIYIENDVNQKIPTCRNEAISKINSKYIAIQDGDDITLSDRFRLEVEFLEKNNDIFCTGSEAQKIDLDGNVIDAMDYPPETHDDIVYQIIRKLLNPIIDPSTMFRKDVFDRLGGYTLRKDIYTAPDFHLWTRAMLEGERFHNIQKPLIQYRDNPNGMTLQHKKEMIGAFMKIWRGFVPKYRKFLQENR